ncbi:PAS domain S-box protein [Flavobacterium hydrophilum]|nr:PAS domain S-box protein [Flavobacterium hydrophilum]
METKILIIEQDSSVIKLIQRELELNNIICITNVVQSMKEFVLALNQFKPDLIISNYSLSFFDGITAFEIKEKLAPQIPFIFVSKIIGQEDVVEWINKDFIFFNSSNNNTFFEKSISKSYKEKQSFEVIDNLSEQKKADDAFKMSESFSTGILDSLASHIAVINAKGTILKVNKSWNTFAQNNGGYPQEKYGEGANYFEACNIQNIGTEEFAFKALKGIKNVLNGIVNEFYLEYPCHSPQKDMWFNMRVSRFESSENMALIEHHDISERKIAEIELSGTTKALQKSLNDNNKILNFSVDLICSYDEKGLFVNVNKASEIILGYKPEELIGKKYMDLIFHDDIEITIDAVNNVQNGVQLTMFENRYIHKNGNIVYLLWSAAWDDVYKISYGIAKDITDKKKLEKAFEIERQRFDDLYLQAPSCMGILKGPNHVYELANNLYLKLIDKKDIIGKTVKEVLPELEAQGIFEFLDTVYKTGETFSANEMLIKFDYHGDGKLHDTYLNFIYQAHRGIDGTIDGILFFANDVTEQVLSRKKIEDSLLRYNSLIEQASDAICFMDESMKIIEANHYACDKLGYSKKEILQLSIEDFFLEEDLKVSPLRTDALKRGKTIRDERRVKRKDGILLDVELSAKKLKDGNTLLFVRDISEHKKAQNTLKENEKKYRYLFDHNPMAMWVIDLVTLKFLDVNKMAVLQYGYSREEFLSMNVLDIRPDHDKDNFIKSLNSSEINATSFNRGVWNHQKKDGTIIPVEIIAHEIIYEGIPARFILSNDITDRKKAELNLERRNKELIKTNSELDRFVYSVSHDLRSPLTSILGLLSFIEDESEEEDTLEHAKMIRNSINRLDEFIKNILNYSRNNRTGLEVEKISIQETVYGILDSLQSVSEAKGINYEIDIKELYPFYTDRLRLNTILENLISNAIKYHKREECDKYIRITGCSDKENLNIIIADNGIGIAPEYHQKIFEMFFRISGNKDGSGIGLYIVKDTIEILQGSIELKSEKGQGTTFIIKLKNLKP